MLVKNSLKEEIFEGSDAARRRVLKSLSYLPRALCREIIGLCEGRVGGLSEIREIRIRRGTRCSLLYKNEYIPLGGGVSADEMDELLIKLCEDSLYAHRENLSSGYIPIGDGVRVGIYGRARYDSRGAVGISELSGLLFRIPGHKCAFAEELFAVWDAGVGTGMLIYSPPGVGKTSALRALAGHIGSGRGARRVVVVDERCEFVADDYRSAEVDVLYGYKKRQGLEIAVRTMSPEVLMVDELGGDDAEAIGEVIRCGVPVVATAHAGSLEELVGGNTTSLLAGGAFSTFVGISQTDGIYSLAVNRS